MRHFAGHLSPLTRKDYIVNKSNSPQSSSVVLVTKKERKKRKKDGSQRLCIDYRQVHAVAVKNMPFFVLTTPCAHYFAKRFSALYVTSRYRQVLVDSAGGGKAAS